jgi:NADPH:quinone reductase-like Zn-dependent oxidoreductase
VLINGASGGTGTFAVQIAKAFGAEVTGVCSTRNLELVRSLGADRVIDYAREDFAREPQAYDLLLDNVGNRSVADMLRVIRPGGACVVVGFTRMGLMLQQSMLGPRRARARGITWAPPASGEPSVEHMEALDALLEAGKVVPEIERRHPLEELPEALRYVETGHARAKIVVTL